MTQYRQLFYGNVLPASFLSALQEFIGGSAPNFHLTLANTATVQVVAGTNSAQVGLGIDGLWRYVSATVNASVTGAPGQYDIFATTSPDSFSNTPTPDTDNTVYAFGLQALTHGSSPAFSGTVSNFRKVGELDWDGVKITGLRQLVGELAATAPITPTSPAAGVIPHRVIAAASQAALLQSWESAAGAILAGVTPTGGLSLSDALTTTAGSFSGALAAATFATTGGASIGGSLTVVGSEVIDGTLTVDGVASLVSGGTSVTPSPSSDSSTKVATTAFVQSAIAAAIGALPGTTTFTLWVPHIVNYDDQTTPPANPGVVGRVPITFAGDQTMKLVGVKAMCATLGSSPSVFKIQSDHAVHGTLVDVAGLTGLEPLAGGVFASTILGTALTLSDGDQVVIYATLPGNSLGCVVAPIFGYVA